MREIKFRAGCKYDNSMFDPAITYSSGKLNNYFEDDMNVFMQYTGLKDKNGVKIYEGDIVKALIQDSHCLAKVFWSPYYLTFMVEQICRFCKDTEYLSNQPKSIEVVGNIYENHELLEVKQ